MVEQARKLVSKQLGRVRLRLFLQIALQSLLLAWAIGLMLAAAWFLVRPFAFASQGESLRWTVPAAILGVATLGGCLLAWIRRPNLVTASLAMDDKFVLKERVTTFLTLSDEQLETPAGQALVHDVVNHLSRLQITGEFPIRIPGQQMLLPAGAFALALVACLIDPFLGGLRTSWANAVEPEPRLVKNAQEIEQQLDNLKKVVNQRNQEEGLAKSEALKEMEKEFEKLINQPLDVKNEEKVRERLNEFRKLDDLLKERLDTLREKAEKIDALKKQLEKLNLNKDKVKDGPAKDFEDALMKGNLDKAHQALEKLVKDMKNDKLTKEDQKKLNDQLKELQEKMQNLLDKNQDLMKELKKRLDEGKINADQFNREKNALDALKDLTDIVGEAKDALEKSGTKEGAQKLDELAERLRSDVELNDEEIRDILRDQQEIEDAMRLLGGEDGDEGEDGEGDGKGGGRPGRRRPISPNDPNSKILNQRQKAEIDAKGIQRVTGYARGGNFNKIDAKAVEGAFRQAVQEAPEALDRQRIPDDAADIARRYFEKLGSQK
jgi:hypothetical protein